MDELRTETNKDAGASPPAHLEAPTDRERTEWLADPELRKYMFDFAKSRLEGDVDAAKEAVQTVLTLAIARVLAGKGPMVRGEMRRWVTPFLKHFAHDWRRRRGLAVQVTLDMAENVAVDDLIEGRAKLLDLDRVLSVTEEVLSENPEHARRIERAVEDARSRGALTPAERQAVKRARANLKRVIVATSGLSAVAIGAILASIVLLAPRRLGLARLDDLSYTERAQVLRDSAAIECRAHRWKVCIAELDSARRLDPAGDKAPVVQDEWRQAAAALPAPMQEPKRPPEWLDVAELRKSAMRACDNGEWSLCLQNLDGARAYDPLGDLTDEISEYRKQALLGLLGTPTINNTKLGPQAPSPKRGP